MPEDDSFQSKHVASEGNVKVLC